MRASRYLLIAVLGVVLIPSLSTAQSLGDRNWGFSLGAFITDQNFDTEFFGNLGGQGFTIDLEEDLGLDPDSTVFRLDAFWRISGKHRLDFSWFDLSRDATGNVGTEFEWQDTVYPIDIGIYTDLQLAVYKAAYGYEFLQHERSWFAGTLGLFIADVDLLIELTSSGEFESGSVTAPLPVLGVRGGYAMTDRWLLHYSGEVFFIEVDDTKGQLYDVYGSISYLFTDNFALGLGYNYVNFDLDGTDERLNAELDWRYAGFIASLRFVF